MKAANRRAGRRAQKSGALGEGFVEAVNDRYRAQRRAHITKRPTPYRQIGPNGARGFAAIRTAASGVDFAGIVLVERGDSSMDGQGIHVAFDLKRSMRAALPLVNPKGGPTLKRQQAAELELVEHLGGIAGVLVLVAPKVNGSPTHRWFWVPWAGWKDAVRRAAETGRKSLGVDLLSAHGIECPRGDWLDAAVIGAS
jgi:penicillin-binding protein-related factor A (putative recombinase)